MTAYYLEIESFGSQLFRVLRAKGGYLNIPFLIHKKNTQHRCFKKYVIWRKFSLRLENCVTFTLDRWILRILNRKWAKRTVKLNVLTKKTSVYGLFYLIFIYLFLRVWILRTSTYFSKLRYDPPYCPVMGKIRYFIINRFFKRKLYLSRPSLPLTFSMTVLWLLVSATTDSSNSVNRSALKVVLLSCRTLQLHFKTLKSDDSPVVCLLLSIPDSAQHWK